MMNENKKGYVLIVDDVNFSAQATQKMIMDLNYRTKVVLTVAEAINVISNELPQLILTDLCMPQIDGYDFIKLIKANPISRNIPIIVISAIESAEERFICFELGAVDYITKPIQRKELELHVNMHMKMYEMQEELERYNKKLETMIKQQFKKIEDEQKNILVAMANVIDEQISTDDHNHLNNVSFNAQLIAQSLAFTKEYEDYISEDYIRTIRVAALLHDIGKIRVVNEPVCVDLSLENIEKNICAHAESGAQILECIQAQCSKNRFIKMAIDIARYHHANWSEEYKNAKIFGDDIPLSARIVRVAGDYDSLSKGRNSIKKRTKEEVIDYFVERAGTQYDPLIIDVMIKIINQLH